MPDRRSPQAGAAVRQGAACWSLRRLLGLLLRAQLPVWIGAGCALGGLPSAHAATHRMQMGSRIPSRPRPPGAV